MGAVPRPAGFAVTTPPSSGEHAEDRVWLLRTPSHDRLVLASEMPKPPPGNYSVTDVTAAVREFIGLNPEWVDATRPAVVKEEKR